VYVYKFISYRCAIYSELQLDIEDGQMQLSAAGRTSGCLRLYVEHHTTGHAHVIYIAD
jgi:hypothetical protein